MRRIFALGVVLGLAIVFGSTTLVSADCAYHKAQAAIKKANTSKEVATAPTVNKTVLGQLQTAQSDKPVKPASQTNN
jgi:hypothetical protein